MSLVTHYKPSLLCLKLKHLQAFHGFCQAAHLPYISLTGWMETCAHTAQQPCTFAGNVGELLEVRNFSVCRADYQISSTHTLGPAAEREQRQRGTAQYNRTAPSKSTEQLPGLCQAKHTHTQVYFDVFQVKTLLLQIAAHKTWAVKGRRDGLLGGSCTEWEWHQALQAVYSGQVAKRASWSQIEVLTVKFSWIAISHRNTQGTLAAGPSDIWQTRRFNLMTDPICTTDVARHNCTSQEHQGLQPLINRAVLAQVPHTAVIRSPNCTFTGLCLQGGAVSTTLGSGLWVQLHRTQLQHRPLQAGKSSSQGGEILGKLNQIPWEKKLHWQM